MKKNYVILPVYNDWDSLKKVLEILNQSFKNLKSNNFIIIVNDFSSKKLILNKKYSNPDIFSLTSNLDNLKIKSFKQKKINTSFIQTLPFGKTNVQKYRFIFMNYFPIFL